MLQKAVLLSLSLALACSCSLEAEKPTSPLAALSVQATNLTGNFWTNSAWNDPCVLALNGGGYRMYLSRNTNDLYNDGRVEPVSLFYATSTNGLDWTVNSSEMLGLGSSGQWDYNKVETPTAVIFKGKYHLFYSGGSQSDGVYKIGHAVSADGLTAWTKDAAAVLSPATVASATGLANILHVAEPAAMVHGSGDTAEIWLYFCVTSQRSGPGPTSKMAIYRATSSDGQSFGTISLVLEQGPLYPASAGYNGYSTPSVLVSERGIELFYDVYKHTGNAIAADEQVALHHAISTDGLHFTEDSRTLLWNNAHPWTAREIRAGNALIVGNEYYLWFAADNYSHISGTWAGGMTIGLARWAK